MMKYLIAYLLIAVFSIIALAIAFPVAILFNMNDGCMLALAILLTCVPAAAITIKLEGVK